MKKLILSSIAAIATIVLFANPANNTPVKVVQPNGDTILISLHGDEYGAWYEENTTGQVIVQNASGAWVYASAVEGRIVASNTLVSDKDTHIVPKQSEQDIREIINEMLISNKSEKYIYADSVQHETSSKSSRVIVYDKAEVPFPHTGAPKLLVILVQFPDVQFQNVNTVKQYYQDLFNATTLPTSNCSNTGESFKKFWHNASYGHLQPQITVVGPYTVSKTQKNYGENNGPQAAKELIKKAVDFAANNVDMSLFDNNNDNWVEGVVIIYAGRGADETQPWVSNEERMNHIWPHQGYIAKTKKDGVYIQKYCMSAELYTDNPRGIGTVCHEVGHLMGAMDFYDSDYAGSGGNFKGTGRWDLMGSGSWNNDSKSPAHPNPWLKCYLWNWSTAQELNGTNKLYTLYPAETGANRIYRLTTAAGDFFLLENKQQDYINDRYNHKGLVVFHVHSDMNNALNKSWWKNNDVNVGHPQRLYVVNPHSTESVPGGGVGSYDSIYISRSFTNPLAPKPFFTSTTTPNNLGWSQQPLSSPKDITMIHAATINGETVVRFMLNPTIEGTYKFCDDETYTIDNVPSAATTKWGCVGDDGQFVKPGLKVTSSDRSSATYIRDGYIAVNPSTGESVPFYSSGKKTLRAVVNLHNQTYTMTKEVDLPIFKYVKIKSHNSMPMYFVGGTYTFSVENLVDGPIDGISWIISGSAMSSSYIEKGKTQISIAPNKAGTLNIRVIDENGCSPYNETSVSYQILQQAVVIPRNPAEGTADFSVVMRSGAESTDGEPSALSAAAFDAFSGTYEEPYNGAYRLELWHKQFGMVRSLDMPENNPDTQINIAGLAPGDYIVRLIIGGNVVNTARLRIK
ncbi:MAG: M6 family metalloprotease domain-containing protein [Candidatus Aphodosoma sp.]